MDSTKVLGAIARTAFKLAITGLVIIIIYSGSTKAYDFGHAIFAEESMAPEPGKTISVTIIEGKTVKEIGEILQTEGIIKDANLFYFQEMFSKYCKELKPGVFELNTSMTPDEIMEIMAKTQETEG